MKGSNVVVTFSFILALFGMSSSVFLGGTISWRENRNKVGKCSLWLHVKNLLAREPLLIFKYFFVLDKTRILKVRILMCVLKDYTVSRKEMYNIFFLNPAFDIQKKKRLTDNMNKYWSVSIYTKRKWVTLIQCIYYKM